MRFDPMSEEQLQEINLITDGIYIFEVKNAEDKISKSGNEMIQLTISVWDKDNRERILFDYLLPSLAYKLRHFSEAVDLLDRYNDGLLNAKDCVGKSGKCKIGIQKDKTGIYLDKNVVKDYIPHSKSGVEFNTDEIKFTPTIQPVMELNDEIPF